MTTTAGDPRFVAAHDRLLADPSVQFDFPSYAPPPPPPWLEGIIAFFKWLSPAFPYLFWGAIILTVLAVAYVVVTNVEGFGLRRSPKRAATEDWTPDPQAARALLAEAEALAAAGRYGEAARLLLLRSVEDIGQRLPEFLKPSLTARDIAAAEALPDTARPAFASIARVVEVSAFGAQTVTAEAWVACRAAYARFALPQSWHRA